MVFCTDSSTLCLTPKRLLLYIDIKRPWLLFMDSLGLCYSLLWIKRNFCCRIVLYCVIFYDLRQCHVWEFWKQSLVAKVMLNRNFLNVNSENNSLRTMEIWNFYAPQYFIQIHGQFQIKLQFTVHLSSSSVSFPSELSQPSDLKISFDTC